MHKVDLAPITVNKAWQGRRYKTPEYKAWRQAAFVKIKALKLEKIEGWVEVHINSYLTHFAITDESNLLKAIFDALVDAEVIEDDRFIKRHTSEKHKSKENYFTFEVVPYVKKTAKS
jgi:Holliday junction resolvase RusA-like endonuclease